MFPFAPPAISTNSGSGGGLTFVSSASSLGTSVTLPSSISAGDIGVLFDVAMNSGLVSIPTTVVPTGWTGGSTQVGAMNITGSYSGDFYKCAVAYKIFTGVEGGTAITGMTGGSSNDKIVVVFRRFSGSFTGLAGQDQENTNAGGGPPPITILVGSAPLVVVGMSWTSPSGYTLGMSPAATTTIENGARMQAGYIIYNTGPTNNTMSNTASNGQLNGLYIY